MHREVGPLFYGGGIDGFKLTLTVGLLLALFGAGFFVGEVGVFVYTEYRGRDRYHRSHREAASRIIISLLVVLVGWVLLFGTGPNMRLP